MRRFLPSQKPSVLAPPTLFRSTCPQKIPIYAHNRQTNVPSIEIGEITQGEVLQLLPHAFRYSDNDAVGDAQEHHNSGLAAIEAKHVEENILPMFISDCSSAASPPSSSSSSSSASTPRGDESTAVEKTVKQSDLLGTTASGSSSSLASTTTSTDPPATSSARKVPNWVRVRIAPKGMKMETVPNPGMALPPIPFLDGVIPGEFAHPQFLEPTKLQMGDRIAGRFDHPPAHMVLDFVDFLATKVAGAGGPGAGAGGRGAEEAIVDPLSSSTPEEPASTGPTTSPPPTWAQKVGISGGGNMLASFLRRARSTGKLRYSTAAAGPTGGLLPGVFTGFLPATGGGAGSSSTGGRRSTESDGGARAFRQRAHEQLLVWRASLVPLVTEHFRFKVGGPAYGGKYMLVAPPGAVPERLPTAENCTLEDKERWLRHKTCGRYGLLLTAALTSAIFGGNLLRNGWTEKRATNNSHKRAEDNAGAEVPKDSYNGANGGAAGEHMLLGEESQHSGEKIQKHLRENSLFDRYEEFKLRSGYSWRCATIPFLGFQALNALVVYPFATYGTYFFMMHPFSSFFVTSSLGLIFWHDLMYE